MRTPAKRIAPVAAKGLELAGRLKQVRLSVQAGHSSAFRRPRGLAARGSPGYAGSAMQRLRSVPMPRNRRFDDVYPALGVGAARHAVSACPSGSRPRVAA